MRILVVDDDDAIRTLIMRLFQRRGDSVAGACDGHEAITTLDGGPFDLVLLDLMMPRVNGMGVLAHLAARKESSPRVILMTAAAASLTDKILPHQVAAIVPKPFEIRALMSLADDTLARHTPLNG